MFAVVNPENTWKEQSKCGSDPWIRSMLFNKDADGNPDPIDIFHDKKYVKQARRYCLSCPVRKECLSVGLANTSASTERHPYQDEDWGVMGGLSHNQRATKKTKALRKIQLLSEQMTELFPASDNPIAS